MRDCESMVDAAIARGLADPKRLGVGGWSHGGFLTGRGNLCRVFEAPADTFVQAVQLYPAHDIKPL